MQTIEMKFVVPDSTLVDKIAAIARRSAAELDGYLVHTGAGFRIDVPAKSKGKGKPDLWDEAVARAKLSVYEGGNHA